MSLPLGPALSPALDDLHQQDSIFLNNTFTPDPAILSTFVQPPFQEPGLLQAPFSTGQSPSQPQLQPVSTIWTASEPAPAPATSLPSQPPSTDAFNTQKQQQQAKAKKIKRAGRSIPVSGARNGTSWSEEETRVLQEIIDLDLDIATAFNQIGRTTDAVKRKWRKMLVAQEKHARQSAKQPVASARKTTTLSTSSKMSDLSDSDLSDSSLSDASNEDEDVAFQPVKRPRTPSSDQEDEEGPGRSQGPTAGRKRKREPEARNASCDPCRVAHKRCKHEESGNSTSRINGGDSNGSRQAQQTAAGANSSSAAPVQQRHGNAPRTTFQKQSKQSQSKRQQPSRTQGQANTATPKKRGPGRPRKTDAQRAAEKVSTSSLVTSDHYIPRKRRSVEDYEFSEAFVKEHLLDADQILESPPKRWSGRRAMTKTTLHAKTQKGKEEAVTPRKYAEDGSESAMRSTLPGNTPDSQPHKAYRPKGVVVASAGPLQPRSPGNTPKQVVQPRKKRLARTRAPVSTLASLPHKQRQQTQDAASSTTSSGEHHFQESPDHLLKQPFVHGDRLLPLRPTRPSALSPSPLTKPKEGILKGYVLLSQLLNPELASTRETSKETEERDGTRADQIAMRATGSALDGSDPFTCQRFAFSDSAVRDDTF